MGVESGCLARRFCNEPRLARRNGPNTAGTAIRRAGFQGLPPEVLNRDRASLIHGLVGHRCIQVQVIASGPTTEAVILLAFQLHGEGPAPGRLRAMDRAGPRDEPDLPEARSRPSPAPRPWKSVREQPGNRSPALHTFPSGPGAEGEPVSLCFSEGVPVRFEVIKRSICSASRPGRHAPVLVATSTAERVAPGNSRRRLEGGEANGMNLGVARGQPHHTRPCSVRPSETRTQQNGEGFRKSRRFHELCCWRDALADIDHVGLAGPWPTKWPTSRPLRTL